MDPLTLSPGLACILLFWDFRLLNAAFQAFVWRCDRFSVNNSLLRRFRAKNHIRSVNHQNREIRPQGLDLGGSMALNEANLRPWWWYLLFSDLHFVDICPKSNKALDPNCFLVYHDTLFVVIPRKKEWAVDIEILMELASPNQSAQTKNDCSAISS